MLVAYVRKACNGDTDAQAWLYHQYAKDLYNNCLRMTGDTEKAKDIVQEAFIQAFTKLKQLKEERYFGTWLTKIMITKCIRELKNKIKWQQLTDADISRTDDGDISYLNELSIETIHKEIMSLPDGCRQVFNLYVFEEYTHKDIAELLGITESTSKSQYHRSRQLLKERIKKYF